MSSFISDLPLTKEKISFEINQLRTRLVREPTNDEIASHLNVPKKYIDKILPRPFLHNKYEDKYYEPGELSSTPTPLKSDDVIKTLQPLQGRSTGGKSKKSLNKNNKKLSRRRSNKKNKKSMKRK
jgi:hypothetical protein